jgi:hypothetical protein
MGRPIDWADFVAFLGEKKGVSKKKPRTSMPWALNNSAASILSRPPEKTHMAFMKILFSFPL